MEEKEPSYTVGGNVNWYSHYGKQYGVSLKKKKKKKTKLKNTQQITPKNYS